MALFSDQRPEVDGRPDAGLRRPGRQHQDLERHLEAGVKNGVGLSGPEVSGIEVARFLKIRNRESRFL